MLCYANAMLCYAMLCYAMLCYAMLCYAMLCYAMLCYAMLCKEGRIVIEWCWGPKSGGRVRDPSKFSAKEDQGAKFESLQNSAQKNR